MENSNELYEESMSPEAEKMIEMFTLEPEIRGHRFCFTGPMPQQRSRLVDRIIALGGTYCDAVDSDTDYLIFSPELASWTSKKLTRVMGLQDLVTPVCATSFMNALHKEESELLESRYDYYQKDARQQPDILSNIYILVNSRLSVLEDQLKAAEELAEVRKGKIQRLRKQRKALTHNLWKARARGYQGDRAIVQLQKIKDMI